MLRHLSEFTTRVFDLIEAEGRALRAVVARVGLGLSLTIVACLLLLVGVGLLLAGAWLRLEQSVGPAGASAITGILTLALAAGALALAAKLTK